MQARTYCSTNQRLCFQFELSQVIGTDKKYEDQSPEGDDKKKLRFLTEDGKNDFIQDLGEIRRTSLIFPPLKTFNGLPSATVVE